jgi:hypothetical protein
MLPKLFQVAGLSMNAIGVFLVVFYPSGVFGREVFRWRAIASTLFLLQPYVWPPGGDEVAMPRSGSVGWVMIFWGFVLQGVGVLL